MKQARLWKYIAFALPLSILGAACSDSFLERPPIDTLTDGIYYQTDEEVIMATAPLYNIGLILTIKLHLVLGMLVPVT
jgi:hypothetical protein